MKLLILLLISHAASASAVVVEGQIFDVNSPKHALVAKQEIDITDLPSGDSKFDSKITNLEGKILVLELATFKGSKILSQEITDVPSRKKYVADFSGGKVKFSEFEIKDEGAPHLVSSKTDTPDGVILTGPVTENFVKDNWDRLQKGEKIEAEYAVFEMQKLIGFGLRKKAIETRGEKELMIVEMRPLNFFVRMAVPPMELSFDTATKSLVHFKGRTALKLNRNSSSPLIADVSFEKKSPAAPVQKADH